MIWDEIVKVALIGTDRSNLSTAVQESLKQQGVDISKGPTKMLLDGAALYAQLQRSGSYPKPWAGALPDKASNESGTTCSRKSRSHLQLILKGEYLDLLPEFVYHLVKHKKLLPLDLLPSLLDQSKSNNDLWKVLRHAIGERGRWLIQQNPEWQALLFDPQIVDWETGTRDERFALLRYHREHDPAKAREYIQTTWQQDDLKSREQFLKILKTKASKYDEDFLENCLDDRRKEIRKTAASVLTHIPYSKRTDRIFNRLVDQMILNEKVGGKKEKIKIQLPEELSPSLIRDGIDPASRWFKGGVKASRFGQMIAIIPPKRWEVHFEKSATDTLHLFVKTEWSELLLQAVTEATVTHRDMEWAEAILLFWLDNYSKVRWQYFNPIQLFANIDEKVFNKVALIHIQQKSALLDEESPLSLLLRNVNLPWQDLLSTTFIQSMQGWIAGETSHYWSGWHLRPILKKAAIYSNPQLFEQLVKGWSSHSYAWNSWEKEVERFLSVLKFRKDMIEELAK
jgi:hypothetical protein